MQESWIRSTTNKKTNGDSNNHTEREETSNLSPSHSHPSSLRPPEQGSMDLTRRAIECIKNISGKNAPDFESSPTRLPEMETGIMGCKPMSFPPSSFLALTPRTQTQCCRCYHVLSSYTTCYRTNKRTRNL
jgi:hypothetical protein